MSCLAITTKNLPCKNKVSNDSKYCHIHIKSQTIPREDSLKDTSEEKKDNLSKDRKDDLPKEIILPHSRCNFITDNNLILIGARPIKETIDSLISFNIKLFVNLEDSKDAEWYKALLPSDRQYLHKPIKNGKAPSIKDALQIFDIVKTCYSKGELTYIHCNGGHGRAATIGAFIIGTLFSLSAPKAIAQIEKYRESRIDKSRNFIPTPETNLQVEFLVKRLGAAKTEIIPDRSDRSWLKKK
jgi:protein-tyrosine phosphatase